MAGKMPRGVVALGFVSLFMDVSSEMIHGLLPLFLTGTLGASALILGLVEGITEYLPISSTGHLLVTNESLGLRGTASEDRALEAYAICIQAGAILAVFVVYLDRIRQMFEGLLGRSEEGRRVLFAVMTSFVPTAVIVTTEFLHEARVQREALGMHAASLGVAMALLSGLLLLPITLLFGTAYPLALAARRDPDVVARAASPLAWSTLGSIGGSLLAGFVLVPYFGLFRSVAMAAMLSIANCSRASASIWLKDLTS